MCVCVPVCAHVPRLLGAAAAIRGGRSVVMPAGSTGCLLSGSALRRPGTGPRGERCLLRAWKDERTFPVSSAQWPCSGEQSEAEATAAAGKGSRPQRPLSLIPPETSRRGEVVEPDGEKSIPEPLCLHWRVCGQSPVQVLDGPHSLSMFSCPQGSVMSRQFLFRRRKHSDHVMDTCRVTFHPAAGTGEKDVHLMKVMVFPVVICA